MGPFPASVRESVDSALSQIAGGPDSIVATATISGGCIHNGTRLTAASGASFFLKWNASAPPGVFEAEADGLRALRRAVGSSLPGFQAPGASLVVPEPLAWGDAGGGWLLMEYVEPSYAKTGASELLGRGLAAIHDTGHGAPMGWRAPNWIGSLSQDNTAASDWPSFWRERRIGPQLALARASGALGDPVFDRLLESIPAALNGAAPSALLHGDLWSGNTFTATNGVPVLIDPAVYVGDGEVDLAMTELFGGFAPAFYHAYDELRPISPEYRSHRRDLYQLYYLLVHVNLFGGAYAAAARHAGERIVAALR